MHRASRITLLTAAALLATAGISHAQYMRITTDNPADNTRLRASGTTVLTITLNTNHDRDGSLQSCNSHSSASCGTALSGTPLDLFSYQVYLSAAGGTVSWGAFSPDSPDYTPLQPQVQDAHDVQFTYARPPGTTTPAGLITLGTIAVTPLSGSPNVAIARFPNNPLDPTSLGTSFGTSCSANAISNTYILGDATDPCGASSGLPPDWFDADGAASAAGNTPPQIAAPASATAPAGSPFSVSATATDADASDVLNVTASGAPASLALSSAPGNSPVTATLSGTPTAAEAGSYSVLWAASDGAGGNANATTALTVTRVDTAPTVAAPDTALASETIPFALAITVSDAEGDPIASLTTSPLPAGATFSTSAFNATGSLSWTPATGQQGEYPVTFTATSGSPALSGSKTTLIRVGPRDRRPVVTGPTSATINENQTLSATFTASDPDGDPMTSLVASGTQNTPLPPGLTYTVNGSFTQMLMSWTPTFSQAGVYTLDIEATSRGFLGEQINSPPLVFKITVRNVDRAPSVSAPASASGTEGDALSVPVSASDPDGDAIATLTAAPIPSGATFTTGAGNTLGTFAWTPSFSQEGTYSVTFTATSGSPALTGSATTQITIAHANQPPALSAPSSLSVDEGSPLTFTVSATDGDGDHVALSAPSRPLGAGFIDHGDNTGTFDWTPGFGQAGTHTVTFAGNDGNGDVATASTVISVHNVNRAPVSNPGGPYSGLTNVPVSFNGTASSDPDGDPLTYMWDFGDLMSGTGSTPSHTYTAAGTFTVTLTVQDNGTPPLSNAASTTATIATTVTPRIYVAGNATIKLGTGKPRWCAQLEPVNGNFNLTDVSLGTLVLKYGAAQISAESGKTVIGGDKDGNGISEIGVCFSKSELRTLFASLPPGRTTVAVAIEADLVAGGKLSGSFQVEVQQSGSGVTAMVAPNPLNPATTMTYSLSKPGFVKVRLYDLSGRLVKTLAEESYAAAGYHEIRIDGRGDSGERLPSGVYFYNIQTVEGAVMGRLTILK